MARWSLSLSLIVLLGTYWGNSLQALEELFLRANVLYQQGEYQKALDCCDALEDKGPAVWYTMGRCALQERNYCQAHLFLQRAKKGAPVELYKSIDTEITELYKQLEYEDIPSSSGVVYMIRMYTNHVPLWIMQLIFIIFWYLGFLAWWMRKRVGGIMIVFMLVMISILGVMLAVRYYDRHVLQAIVVCPTVKLYTGPHEGYHVLGTVRTAECVQIVQEYASWYNVKSVHGNGWIVKDAILPV